MIRHVKILLGISFVVTCLLAGHEAWAELGDPGQMCSTPPAGTCIAGYTCVQSSGLICHFNGTGAWSVCITAPWYCTLVTTGCNGNYIDVSGQLMGTCTCPASAVSPDGC
jgi:hypothetical protein